MQYPTNHRTIAIALIITFLLISLSCKNDRNKMTLPNDLLINQVISRVVEIDSLNYNKGILISRQLCPYTLNYSQDRANLKDMPSTPNYLQVNPISPKEIIDFMDQRLVKVFSALDTSFIAYQITYSKNRYLDTLLLDNFKFAEIDYLQFTDYFRIDSIYVFYIPIFNHFKKYVYVNRHYKGGGTGTILKWDKDNWTIINEFDTWNRD